MSCVSQTTRVTMLLAVWAACGAGVSAQDGPTCDAKFQTSEGGMAAYWTFNQSGAPLVDDYAGYGGVNHGATWSADGACGGAMSFDGVNDFADISDPTLNIPTWPELTIAVWFLNDGGGDLTGYGQKIFNKSTWFSDFGLQVGWGVSGELRFWAGSESDPWARIVDESRDYRDGLWHHAVVVKTGPHGELWVDGELKGVSEALGSPDNDEPLLLGFTSHGDSNQQKHWSGMIDEFAIFDRVLDEDEIVDLYTTSAAGRDYCEQLCRPDLDGDGTLDTDDVLQFLGAWAVKDPMCDWNADGAINTMDVLAYLNDWNAGC